MALSARLPAAASTGAAGQQAARALSELHRAGISVGEFGLDRPSLDEAFLALTGTAGIAGPQQDHDEEAS
jgi:ABC-2 type transport system ATP-binding protein